MKKANKYSEQDIILAAGAGAMQGIACEKFHDLEKIVERDPELKEYVHKDGSVSRKEITADNDLDADQIFILGTYDGAYVMHKKLHAEYDDMFSDELRKLAVKKVKEGMLDSVFDPKTDSIDDLIDKLPMDMPEEIKDALIGLARASQNSNKKGKK